MADVRLTAINPEDSSVVPVACNAGGQLLVEEQGQGPQGEQGPPGPKGEDGDPFSGNFADDVTFGGSAEFAGGKVAITPGGDLDVDGRISGYRIDLKSGFGGSPATALAVYYDTDATDERISFKADGSASFAGRVKASDFSTEDAEDFYLGGAYQQGGIGSARGAAIFRLSDTDGTHGEQIALRITQNGNQPNDSTITLNFGGSATFASGKYAIQSNGTQFFYGTGGADAGVWHVKEVDDWRAILTVKGNLRLGGNAASPANANIGLSGENGSATFAGGKAGFTAEGYLWCTTVRGDTVMLDATSNGMGVWVDYSPTTRIDEIRDKLDANRGDTGEMPTDTP